MIPCLSLTYCWNIVNTELVCVMNELFKTLSLFEEIAATVVTHHLRTEYIYLTKQSSFEDLEKKLKNGIIQGNYF